MSGVQQRTHPVNREREKEEKRITGRTPRTEKPDIKWGSPSTRHINHFRIYSDQAAIKTDAGSTGNWFETPFAHPQPHLQPTHAENSLSYSSCFRGKRTPERLNWTIVTKPSGGLFGKGVVTPALASGATTAFSRSVWLGSTDLKTHAHLERKHMQITNIPSGCLFPCSSCPWGARPFLVERRPSPLTVILIYTHHTSTRSLQRWSSWGR